MLPQMPRNEFNASISPKVSDTNFPLQSLFSWMALSTKSEVRSEKSEERFQSLFSWMALFNVVISILPDISRLCFNPCFHGWPSSTLSVKGVCNTIGMFQSLFSWMALFNCFRCLVFFCAFVQPFHRQIYQPFYRWSGVLFFGSLLFFQR